MGDSITTGAGLLATNTMQLSIENRGMMATIGGEETWRKVLTLPNIFKVRSSMIVNLTIVNLIELFFFFFHKKKSSLESYKICMQNFFYVQEFNHNLIGYALGNSLTSHPASQLNVAEGGALSMDMPYMAKFLINRMKKDPRIDINNHWKVPISHKIHYSFKIFYILNYMLIHYIF